MQIGKLAKRLGVSPQTIRCNERIGLPVNPARSPSGYRLCDEQTEAFLRFLKKAQKLGFTLQEIKTIWEIRATGKKPCGYVKEQARKKVLQLTQKIQELEELRQILVVIQNERDVPALSGQDESHRVCPLIEGAQISQQQKTRGVNHRAEKES